MSSYETKLLEELSDPDKVWFVAQRYRMAVKNLMMELKVAQEMVDKVLTEKGRLTAKLELMENEEKNTEFAMDQLTSNLDGIREELSKEKELTRFREQELKARDAQLDEAREQNRQLKNRFHDVTEAYAKLAYKTIKLMEDAK